MSITKNTNDWADYWRYIIGANVIPADTRNKVTYVKWTQYQNSPISQEQHNRWKADRAFDKGLAIIAGKVWHSTIRKDLYLILVDLDNKKAIEEFCTLNGNASSTYPDELANLIRWNPDVPEKFLNMIPRPTIEQLVQVIDSSPLGRVNNGSDTFRTRNYAPDPDRPGYLKYDMSKWIPDPNNPGKMKYNDDENFISDHDKAVIEEAQTRRKIMEDILKARGIKIVDRFVEHTSSKKSYDELVKELRG